MSAGAEPPHPWWRRWFFPGPVRSEDQSLAIALILMFPCLSLVLEVIGAWNEPWPADRVYVVHPGGFRAQSCAMLLTLFTVMFGVAWVPRVRRILGDMLGIDPSRSIPSEELAALRLSGTIAVPLACFTLFYSITYIDQHAFFTMDQMRLRPHGPLKPEQVRTYDEITALQVLGDQHGELCVRFRDGSQWKEYALDEVEGPDSRNGLVRFLSMRTGLPVHYLDDNGQERP